ncbi:hypothetical protein BXA18_21245, partial [Acinetobacter baumannii]
AYVKERHAFGQPISQFQNTRFVLAQAKIDELATTAFYERNVALCQNLESCKSLFDEPSQKTAK